MHHRYFNIGINTMHPTIPNVVITKNTVHANIKAVIKRFLRRFSIVCLIKYTLLGNTLLAPKTTVAMAK